MKKRFTLILASMFLTIGAWAQNWTYAKSVEIGDKITDFSTVANEQTVVFKIVNHNRFITISTDGEAGMSATATGLSVFKLHRNGEATNQFSFESAREGYYFPNITNTGWPNYYMTNESQNVFEFLSSKSDNTALSEGQFVVKSTTEYSTGVTGYFDGNNSDFTGWQGKDANCVYEVYIVTPSTETYSTLQFVQNYKKSSRFWDAGDNLTETCPEEVKNLRDNTNHVVRGALTDINVPEGGNVDITFQHNGGDHAMKILGVDIINGEGEVVNSDYHFGSTGSSNSLNDYTLSDVTAGDYTLRYFVCDGNDNDHNLENAQGNITVRGAQLRETTLTATFTNAIGNYTFTYQGIPGTTEPTITGVTGHTLSNKAWDKNYFTAAITFPYPVSNAETTNATLLSSYYKAKQWHAVDKNVLVQTAGANLAELDYWMWAIYPAFDNGAFTFTIKNIATGLFVTANKTGSCLDTSTNNYTGADGAVTLTETGTAFSITSENDFAFTIDGITAYLSINSSGDTDVNLGVYGSTHGGTNVLAPSFAQLEKYQVTIGATGYATLYTPIKVTVPEGVTAYTGALNDANDLLTLTEIAAGSVLPANAGVILQGTANTTYTFSVATTDAVAVDGNVLIGQTADHATSSVDGTVYTLQSHNNGGVAFKKYTGTNLKGFRAYLTLPETTETLAIRITRGGDEDTTGIEQLAGDNAEVVIYDLAGRRVEKMEKGIYIVNGKKVVIR